MDKTTGRNESFIIQILNTQNATWQGTVTWATSKQTQNFRSALELIKLIDSTLVDELAETPSWETSPVER
ncbi:MAG: hypothetical protein RR053_02600 [Evtepia sp.]